MTFYHEPHTEPSRMAAVESIVSGSKYKGDPMRIFPLDKIEIALACLLAASFVYVLPPMLSATAVPQEQSAPATSSASTPSSSPAPQIADLAFLAGDWEGPMWGGGFHAYYCTPEGGRVMSYNTLRKDGRIAYHEFEVFEPEGDKVIFRPFPAGKPADTLTLVECDRKQRKAVCENPQKDFPTRIVYHRVAEDRLVITLSDPHGGSDKTETFDLRSSPSSKAPSPSHG